MGIGGAAGRLVEFGESKRRAQFEATRALLLRDSDGGQESFFGRRRVGRVALQKDFAAHAMQFGGERAIASAVGCRQMSIDWMTTARSKSPASASASASAIFKRPREKQDCSVPQEIHAATHVLETAALVACSPISPNLREIRRTRAIARRSSLALRRVLAGRRSPRRTRSPRISSNSAE